MLAEFLQGASETYEASGLSDAKLVAEKLRAVNVPDIWQTPDQKPHQPALKNSLAAGDCLPVVKDFDQIAEHLIWYNSTDLRARSKAFKGDYCFTPIVGPDSVVESQEFRFGLYLQDPHTFYPAHKHAAVELYLPVSGTAQWQKDDGPFEPVAAGTLIEHATYQPHATKTSEAPLLAFWAWLGDLSPETYSFLEP